MQNAMTNISRSNATNAANHCTMTQTVAEARTLHQPRLSPAKIKSFMLTVTLARLNGVHFCLTPHLIIHFQDCDVSLLDKHVFVREDDLICGSCRND